MLNTPQVGHRVILRGREAEGEFLVLLVDTDRNRADLLRLKGVRRIEEAVPLDTLQLVDQAEPAVKTAEQR